MCRFYIDTIEGYNLAVDMGFEPLMDMRHFDVDIHLRVQIQRDLFGTTIPDANLRFYRWVWERRPHYCEETMRPLWEYSSEFVSHILTRGAYPEMAHDPRNINLLCREAHNQWEFGDRAKMRIYEQNRRLIDKLMYEYSQLH